MNAVDLANPEALRALLFSLHADPSRWHTDPATRELLRLCRDKSDRVRSRTRAGERASGDPDPVLAGDNGMNAGRSLPARWGWRLTVAVSVSVGFSFLAPSREESRPASLLAAGRATGAELQAGSSGQVPPATPTGRGGRGLGQGHLRNGEVGWSGDSTARIAGPSPRMKKPGLDPGTKASSGYLL